MADHVGQRFLGHAEQRGGVGVRQLHRAAGGGQIHGQGRRAVRAGNGKFPAQVFQSGRQTQVVKQGGAQVMGYAPHFTHGGIQAVQRAAHGFVDMGKRLRIGRQ
ncbi:hypothetical protein D3C73_809420 [compost metagenome]